ncbi:hypothetical protein J6590_061198, partial [Homalodisca vitripennis]
MKDVYCAANSWENITDQTLRKSWINLWLTLEFKDNEAENDRDNLLQLVKQDFVARKQLKQTDINEWTAAD